MLPKQKNKIDLVIHELTEDLLLKHLTSTAFNPARSTAATLPAFLPRFASLDARVNLTNLGVGAAPAGQAMA